MQQLKLPKLKKIDSTPKEWKFPVGSMRYGTEVLPKNERKNLLLLSDDIRLPSGVGSQGRELSLAICHRFNIVNLGGAINNPDKGKRLSLDHATQDETGVPDATITLYPWNGYGDEDILRHLIKTEKPDVILHFTDPRFWQFLYNMQGELKDMGIPLTYLNIWDGSDSYGGITDPRWNTPFYQSCDLLMSISKQTYGINQRLLNKFGSEVTEI